MNDQFAEFGGFRKRVQPHVDQLERERLELRRRVMRHGVMIGVASVVLALVVFIVLRSSAPGLAVVPLVAGAVFVIVRITRGQKQWKQRAHGELVPIICDSLDDDLQYELAVPVANFLAPFEALNLVGNWNRDELEHYFRGEHRQLKFEMAHAELDRVSRGKNQSATTVFYGLLYRIQMPFEVETGVSIRANFGWFSKTFGRQAIATGDRKFDETFLVTLEKGAEQSEEWVRNTVAAELRQALVEINDNEGRLAYGRPAFHAGMKYDSLYLALSRYEEGKALGSIKVERRRPFLEVGHCLASQSKLEQGMEAMIEDIRSVYRIIDRLAPALSAIQGRNAGMENRVT